MFDMNQCKPGDKLLMRNGTTCEYVKKKENQSYPHIIRYGQRANATREDNGRAFPQESDVDIVGFAYDISESILKDFIDKHFKLKEIAVKFTRGEDKERFCLLIDDKKVDIRKNISDWECIRYDKNFKVCWDGKENYYKEEGYEIINYDDITNYIMDKEKEDMGRYTIIKEITLEGLYQDKCPIELLDEIAKYYSYPDLDVVLIGTEDELYTCTPECIRTPHKWFIDNGYIGEDVELKPGMVLRNDFGLEYVVLEDGRLYYGKGWKIKEGKEGATKDSYKFLSEYNNVIDKEFYFYVVSR